MLVVVGSCCFTVRYVLFTVALVAGTVVICDMVALISSKVRRPTSETGGLSVGGGGGGGVASITVCVFVPICSKVRKKRSVFGPFSTATTVPMLVRRSPSAGV